MSFITTKFHAILLSGFSRVVLTKCFSSIFHFRQISKFKKGHCSQKKKLNQNVLWICTSTHYILHYYKVSGNSVERFQRSCTNKKGHNSEKKGGIKISCGYAHLHIMSFITTKFHEILLSGFRGVALKRA